MEHKSGDSIDLRCRACRAECVRHRAPVVGGVAEIGGKGAELVVSVAVRAVTGGWVAPVFHDLSCCRCGTSRHGVIACIGVIGTLVVVVWALVPCCL